MAKYNDAKCRLCRREGTKLLLKGDRCFTDKGAFDPTGILTREQAAAIICRMLLGDDAENLTTNSVVFSDVAADAYYAEAVKWATDNGITNGTTSSTFSPGSGCTRAQIVTFLWRLYAEK